VRTRQARLQVQHQAPKQRNRRTEPLLRTGTARGNSPMSAPRRPLNPMGKASCELRAQQNKGIGCWPHTYILAGPVLGARGVLDDCLHALLGCMFRNTYLASLAVNPAVYKTEWVIPNVSSQLSWCLEKGPAFPTRYASVGENFSLFVWRCGLRSFVTPNGTDQWLFLTEVVAGEIGKEKESSL